MAARFCIYGIISVFLVLAFGCGRRFDPPPRPAVVSHMDLSQKKLYIDKTRSTLKIFHSAALDLNRRGDGQSLSRFADEVQNFIRLQVRPIINDFEAGNNLETRIEIAELQLLCSLVYFELQKYWQVRLQLKEMDQRYEDRPEVLKASLDPNEFGFSDIDEGIRSVRERLYLVGENLPRPHLF